MLVNRDGLIAKQDDPAGLNLLEIRFIAALVIFVIACRHINRFQLGMIDGVEEFLQLFRRRVFVEQIAGDDHRLLRCLFQDAD